MKRYLIGAAVVALLSAPAVHAQPATPAKICTGQKDGKYFGVGVELVGRLKSIIEFGPDPARAVVETEGSVDNLRRVARGECSFALVQKDALKSFEVYEPTIKLEVRRVVEVYAEFVHFICNKNKVSGRITELLDNKGKNTVAVGHPGSGPHATWSAITKIEPRYGRDKGPRTVELGGIEALVEVEEGRVDCMLYVAGLNAGFIQDVNKNSRGQLRLLEFNDKDFVPKGVIDNTPIYTLAELPKSGHYSNITGYSKPETITTPATLVVSQRWYEENRSKYNSMLGDLRRWLAERK